METIGVTSVSFGKNKELVKKIKASFPKSKIIFTKKRLTTIQLIRMVEKSDRLIVGLDIINKKILSNSKKLKLISKYGVGLDNIDFKECKKKGIKVNYTQGINKRSVSELVVSASIFLSRNLYASNIKLKRNQWVVDGGENLSKKKFGIIGFGNIGKDLAKLLSPFKCKIYYNDILTLKNINKKYIPKSKEYIYSNCDFISIHTPLTKLTNNLINKNNLRKMKKNTILINTSRGGIINEPDLFSYLRSKKIRGAILDVYKKEPFINNKIMKLENLIALPHVGGSSKESILKMGEVAIKNLK